MSTITRGNKASAGGGTSFVANTPALASEVEADFATIYGDYNGSIDNDNVSATADIALTKLGDASLSSTEHADTQSPGDSSSHTLPTDAEDEVQQIRYALERLALGVDAQRVDGSGTGTTFWGDRPLRGPNLIKNPNFSSRATSSSVPTGWADLGTGTPTFSYVAHTGADLTEGSGVAVQIVAGSAAVAGITQTLTGLKASTRYLVVARAEITTNDAHLVTTGADSSSSFRNIDASTDSTSYATLSGVIQTDSTPTAIVVQLKTDGASGDTVRFSFCGVWECSENNHPIGQASTLQETSTSSVTFDNTTYTEVFTGVAVTCPGPGYEIHVDASIAVENTSTTTDHTVALRVTNGGSSLKELERYLVNSTSGGTTYDTLLHYKLLSPAAGTTYDFNVDGRSTSATFVVTPGTSNVTGTGTRTNYLEVRLVRVSG